MGELFAGECAYWPDLLGRSYCNYPLPFEGAWRSSYTVRDAFLQTFLPSSGWITEYRVPETYLGVHCYVICHIEGVCKGCLVSDIIIVTKHSPTPVPVCRV
jgi:hypothetical protein